MASLMIDCGNENCTVKLICEVSKRGELACLLREMDWFPLPTGQEGVNVWLCAECAKVWKSANWRQTPSEPKPEWPSP